LCFVHGIPPEDLLAAQKGLLAERNPISAVVVFVFELAVE
jgi:hypothetical protein